MAFIEIKNLTHIYHQGTEQEFCALKNINLTVEAGEFVVVLGANGSGKSTLARHLNGLLLPTKGQCLVAGMDTANTEELWQIRQQVGMVFQNPDNQLIAGLVEDDVAFGPENLGMKPAEIRRRVSRALATVGMEDFRKFAPHLLSGGQKQRVAIAGALAMNTQCLILDEATAMLDPEGRQEVMATVQRLHAEKGLTVICITHFMDEAAKADKVFIMQDGRIVRTGTPQKVFAQAEALRKLGLDVPLAVDMAGKLRQHGLNLSQDILTEDDLVAALEAAYVH